MTSIFTIVFEAVELTEKYKVFRELTLACLALIIILSTLYYLNIIAAKNFAILSGLIAILAAIFSAFSNKPIERDDVSVAIDKVLLTYDLDQFKNLKAMKDEEQSIRNYIEFRSNEIFLLKLRSYIVDEIIFKYNNSEISKLVNELQEIEAKLDSINVEYNAIKLPSRLQEIVQDLDSEEKIKFYSDVMDALIDSIPLMPFKKLYKLYFRYSLKERKRRIS